MFEKPSAKQNLKQGIVEESTTTTIFTDNKNQKMEVDGTHPEKKGNKYHKTGTRMESPGTSKTGKTKEHLAQRTTHQTKNNWQDLERGKKKHSKRQKEVERNCSRPMSPFGRSGLSPSPRHQC